MTVMLSEEECTFRDELARQLGSDASQVMRQGMLELGKRIGLPFPLRASFPPAHGHGQPKRKRNGGR